MSSPPVRTSEPQASDRTSEAKPSDRSERAALPIDIRRLPWIRRLAADYAFEYARLADFFAGDPADATAWRDAIARTQAHARQYEAIAGVIAAQQQHRGAPAEARAAGQLLRDPRTVAIVTGQQAGLFGGPLFTLLKALTALQLADAVRATHGVPAVAIFWIDAEDHDWNEVKTAAVLDADLNVRQVSAGDPEGAGERPVAAILLDAAVEQAVAELEAALPPTEFTADLLGALRGAYRAGAGMADAFGRWLELLLGPRGLVVFDAADAAAKPIVADLFAREVEQAGTTSRLAADAGDALQARGYHAQVTPHAGSLALFHLNGGRHAIRVDGDAYAVGERRESKDALLAHVRRSPAQFSPNVLLRPLVQDTLFPTICYVAGPNELAYLGQLRQVYGTFGLPMPLIYQRATATIVDGNAMRFLSRYELPFESLRPRDEAALNALLEAQLPPAVEASLHDTLQAVDERLERLAHDVRQIDPTLEGATRSTQTRMQDDLRKLHAKIIQAAKRKDDTLRRQFHHAQAQVFPAGHPQEREVSVVYFLNKYGPALIGRVNEEVPVTMGTHWVITV